MRTSKKEKLTQERLKELLDYCPDTGVFTWRKKHGTRLPGEVAGFFGKRKNMYVMIDGVTYNVRALAFLYMNGSFCFRNIINIDFDKSNNSWVNLHEECHCDGTLTQKNLMRLINYNPTSGVFTRLTGRRRGKIAGAIGLHGYNYIYFCGSLRKASRLAWLWMEGYWPEYQIDHINRVRNDDSWENLRHVTPQCNMRNRSLLSNNTSGVKGVSLHKSKNKWRAFLESGGKVHSLGYYDSKDDAVCARLAAEQCFNWSYCDSTSTAFQYVQKMLGRQ